MGASAAAIGVAALVQGCFRLTPDRTGDDASTDTNAAERDALPDTEAPEPDASPDSSDATIDARDGSFDADDGAGDGDGDGGSSACPPAAMASDFYVVPGSDGAGCNTFPTIAKALQAAQASAAASPTIHLAQGTYDFAHGESFPIELRGISIEGTGNDTVLSGVGQGGLTGVVSPEGDRVNPTLSTVGTVSATFVVGDAARTTRIANLSISAPVGVQPDGLEAIVCDRGVAQTPPVVQPAANTLIDGVTVQGFEVGVRVTWSSLGSGSGSPTSGCSVRIVSSKLRDGDFGVFADGTLSPPGSAVPQYVSLQIGDVGPGKGNTFSGFTDSAYTANLSLLLDGAGIEVADAVAGAILNNQFAQSDFGIVGIQTAYGPGLDIEDNDLGPLTNGGIALSGAVAIAKLAANTIHDVSMRTDCCGWLGIGLQMNQSWGNWPYVHLARGNSFVSNDIGLIFRSGSVLGRGTDAPLPTDPGHATDFGTASSPGGNRFRCNSAPPALVTATSGLYGADVEVVVESNPAPSAAVPFEGNVWDHAPPTVQIDRAMNPAPGVDVYEFGADAGPLAATLDTADASTSADPCPDGHVP
jgi:hypothetical protein